MNRETNTRTDEIYVFPGEATFKKCKSAGDGRVYLLKVGATGVQQTHPTRNRAPVPSFHRAAISCAPLFSSAKKTNGQLCADDLATLFSFSPPLARA